MARSFTDRCNALRKRIPFAFWLCLDSILAPFLAWGAWSLSLTFLFPLCLVCFAAFFDLVEAVVKIKRGQFFG